MKKNPKTKKLKQLWALAHTVESVEERAKRGVAPLDCMKKAA